MNSKKGEKPMAKIGDGHVAAMGRLGLKELRNALNPSKDSIADTEIGLAGTATQGEIANARSGAGEGAEQESMSLSDLRSAAQQDQAKEQNNLGKDGPDQSRGMER
jgi:hypothetical protein